MFEINNYETQRQVKSMTAATKYTKSRIVFTIIKLIQ